MYFLHDSSYVSASARTIVVKVCFHGTEPKAIWVTCPEFVLQVSAAEHLVCACQLIEASKLWILRRLLHFFVMSPVHASRSRTEAFVTTLWKASSFLSRFCFQNWNPWITWASWNEWKSFFFFLYCLMRVSSVFIFQRLYLCHFLCIVCNFHFFHWNKTLT